jgi:hypothetical protein
MGGPQANAPTCPTIFSMELNIPFIFFLPPVIFEKSFYYSFSTKYSIR